MKKLMLELDALKVESFATGAARHPDGTVRAHAEAAEAEREEAATGSACDTTTVSVSVVLSCWATCELGCSDGCTFNTCASGGRVCCA